MERLAYMLKHRFPALFRWVEALARCLTGMRYGKRVAEAQKQALIEGSVNGAPAYMRALDGVDAEELHKFLADLPPDWLEHFQPHPFDRAGLEKVLRSRAFMNYGLFSDSRMVGYALLKVAPTGSGFIGLLVHPQYGGLGLGKFIVAFLYWQASLAGLRTRSTISSHNPASLKSHQAVADYQVVAELPNDYLMIEFPPAKRDKPRLVLP